MYLDLLRAEWYTSVSDLLLALEDGKAWSDLKLPGRLKLEIKSELLALQASSSIGSIGIVSETQPSSFATTTATTTKTTANEISASGKPEGLPIERQQWMKYFCAEHQTYFYSNLITQESQWEEPVGDHDIFDDYASSAEVSPQRVSESSTKCAINDSCEEEVEGYDDGDDDEDHEEEEDEEEIIWRTLLRSVGSTNPTSAEIVADSSHRSRESTPSSSHKKSDIIVVSDAYAIPDEISVGVLESSASSSALRGDFGRSSSERSMSTTEDDILHPPSYTALVVSRNSSSSRRSERESGSSSPDPLMAQRLIDMGFSPAAVASALRRSDNNLSAAASILLAGRRASVTAWSRRESNTTVSDLPSAASAARRVAARLGLPRMFPPPSAPPPPSYPAGQR